MPPKSVFFVINSEKNCENKSAHYSLGIDLPEAVTRKNDINLKIFYVGIFVSQYWFWAQTARKQAVKYATNKLNATQTNEKQYSEQSSNKSSETKQNKKGILRNCERKYNFGGFFGGEGSIIETSFPHLLRFILFSFLLLIWNSFLF